MFQEVKLMKMGQMQFISPQIGPSMSPAFAFANANQQVALDAGGIETVVPTEPMITSVAPSAPVSTVAPQAWVAPVVVLGLTALVIGLTV